MANFLIGEGAFRRAQARDALASYRKAVAIDSTFAIAALRGAQAAAWIHTGDETDAMVRLALSQPSAPGTATSPRVSLHIAQGMPIRPRRT